MFSIITIGLQVSYGIPIVCKMTVGRKLFQPGPFSLGRHSMTCNAIAVCWVVVSAVSAPAAKPAGVTLSSMLLFTATSWLCFGEMHCESDVLAVMTWPAHPAV